MNVSRNVNGQRFCLGCDQWLDMAEFPTYIEKATNYQRYRPRCYPCHAKVRRRGKGKKKRVNTCRVCLKATVYRANGRCVPCALAARGPMPRPPGWQRNPRKPTAGSANDRETFMPSKPPSERRLQAARHDADQLRLKAAARRADEPGKYMEVAYGEIWHLTVECKNRCGKWVLIPARCYECATGRPRRYLRAEERRELGVAV